MSKHTQSNGRPDSIEMIDNVAAFTIHLAVRQMELNTIQGCSTAVDKDFYANEFTPQLHKTLTSAAEVIEKSCEESRSPLVSHKRYKSNKKLQEQDKQLVAAHHQFLENVRDLFKQMQDQAIAIVDKAKNDHDTMISYDERAAISQLLGKMEEAVLALCDRLQGKGEAFPNHFKDCNYGSWMRDKSKQKIEVIRFQ